MRIALYQILAVGGSLLLMVSGLLRFFHSGSPKELFIAVLYFLANIIIFCM
ncbi:MAG: hypothetical protein PHI59_09130 [Candidatus Omnitrophica bacterium]|nr:hypothetical protein [Candidatus Omnitrophota bacterium]MDD5681385.1 hypothetical protein [Candidatus Omnitrophota bacterium]